MKIEIDLDTFGLAYEIKAQLDYSSFVSELTKNIKIVSNEEYEKSLEELTDEDIARHNDQVERGEFLRKEVEKEFERNKLRTFLIFGGYRDYVNNKSIDK